VKTLTHIAVFFIYLVFLLTKIASI